MQPFTQCAILILELSFVGTTRGWITSYLNDSAHFIALSGSSCTISVVTQGGSSRLSSWSTDFDIYVLPLRYVWIWLVYWKLKPGDKHFHSGQQTEILHLIYIYTHKFIHWDWWRLSSLSCSYCKPILVILHSKKNLQNLHLWNITKLKYLSVRLCFWIPLQCLCL